MATTTRTEELQENNALHAQRKAIRSQRGMKLPYVIPRPGYVQRWVRTQLDGKHDDSNIFAKKQEGWEARKANTLKEGDFLPTTEHGTKGNNHPEMVVGTHNMILMERPQAIHDEYDELVKEDVRLQQQAIDNDVNRFRSEETSSRRESGMRSEIQGGGKIPTIAPD